MAGNSPQDGTFDPLAEIGDEVRRELASEVVPASAAAEDTVASLHDVLERAAPEADFDADGRLNRDAIRRFLEHSVAKEEHRFIPLLESWVRDFETLDAFVQQSQENASVVPYMQERIHRVDHVVARRALGNWLQSRVGPSEATFIAQIVGAYRRRRFEDREALVRARDYVTLLMDYASHPRDWMSGMVNYVIERADARRALVLLRYPSADRQRATEVTQDLKLVLDLRAHCDAALLSMEEALLTYRAMLPSMQTDNEQMIASAHEMLQIVEETRGELPDGVSPDEVRVDLRSELRRLEGERAILAAVQRSMEEFLPDDAPDIVLPDLPCVEEYNMDFLHVGDVVKVGDATLEVSGTFPMGEEQFADMLATARLKGISLRRALNRDESQQPPEPIIDAAFSAEGAEVIDDFVDTMTGDVPVPVHPAPKLPPWKQERNRRSLARSLAERSRVEPFLYNLFLVYFEQVYSGTPLVVPMGEEQIRMAIAVQRLIQEMGISSQLICCTLDDQPHAVLRVSLRGSMGKIPFADNYEFLVDPTPHRSKEGVIEPLIPSYVQLVADRAAGGSYRIVTDERTYEIPSSTPTGGGRAVPLLNTVQRKTLPASLLTPAVPSKVVALVEETFPDIDWGEEIDNVFDAGMFLEDAHLGTSSAVAVPAPLPASIPSKPSTRTGLDGLNDTIASMRSRTRRDAAPGFDPDDTQPLRRKDIRWMPDAEKPKG